MVALSMKNEHLVVMRRVLGSDDNDTVGVFKYGVLACLHHGKL